MHPLSPLLNELLVGIGGILRYQDKSWEWKTLTLIMLVHSKQSGTALKASLSIMDRDAFLYALKFRGDD